MFEPRSLAPAKGVVAEFDYERGLGVVESEDGTRWPFHCTAIADGSRNINVGTVVAWSVRTGRLGRWEAAEITPIA